MPVTPTVSMCAFSMSDFPPPVPRATATTLGLPGPRGLLPADAEAALPEPACHEVCDRPFPASARHEVRIHRIDGNQL